MQKIELLAPAGNLEKLKIAFAYGADAVYCSTPRITLRANTTFTIDELKEGIEYAHNLNKKVYLTTNAFPRNITINNLSNYLEELASLNADGIIVADLGVFDLVKSIIPNIPIHISTQVNIVNWKAVEFFKKLGASRVILAREITANEIQEIREKNKDIELEMFVHGEMCMAYSGRCFLSNYMTARDSNQGVCAHSCRWQYKIYMEELQRPGIFIPIEHTDTGDYFLSSKDLCLIKEIPDIIKIGLDSIKIAGRNKTSYYLGMVVRAYRKAIDAYYNNEKNISDILNFLYNDLLKTRHRDFITGFFYTPVLDYRSQTQDTSTSKEYWRVKGIIIGYTDDNYAIVEVKNKLSINDIVEIATPNWDDFTFTINKIIDFDTKEELSTISGGQNKCILLDIGKKVHKYSFLRSPINDNV